jgi:predicted ATPase
VAKQTRLRAPYLKKISLLPERVNRAAFPFNTLKFLTDEFEMNFDRPITLFVGENGSGKSTLLEGIASLAGFHSYGGSQHHQLYRRARHNDEEDDELTDDDQELEPSGRMLAKALKPAWLPRVSNGYFFRAESFFNVAAYLDEVNRRSRRPSSLLQQSHGESFLSLFKERLGGGKPSMYLLDEPEAALSPARQLVFVCLMRRWEEEGNVQAIIATHAPILMAYPGARLLEFRRGRIRRVEFEETEHYQVMRSFFSDPRGYLEGIIAGEDAGEE